jgi:hypothetical protein
MTKAKRNIGQEILRGLRETKRGKHGRVINVPQAFVKRPDFHRNASLHYWVYLFARCKTGNRAAARHQGNPHALNDRRSKSESAA